MSAAEWIAQRRELLDAADERDRLAAAVERARVLHRPETFEMPNGDTWYRCGRCQHASDRPCATYRALDGTDEKEQDDEVDH